MRALVLSGGGVKGAYQVGVLKYWLGVENRDYDIVCGISVGAINAACLAQFPVTQTREAISFLNGLWLRVNNSKIKKSWCPFGRLQSLTRESVYNTQPLQDWISSELDLGAIEVSRKKLRIVAVSWETGKVKVITEGDKNLDQWVLASSSFPVFFQPIEIEGQKWSDGGLRTVTPLGEAIKAGATSIDIVMCSNPFEISGFNTEKAKAIPDYLFRSLDILTTQIQLADLKICGLKNELAELKPEYRKIDFRLIMPENPLVEDSLDFDPSKIARMIEQGYKDAARPPLVLPNNF